MTVHVETWTFGFLWLCKDEIMLVTSERENHLGINSFPIYWIYFRSREWTFQHSFQLVAFLVAYSTMELPTWSVLVTPWFYHERRGRQKEQLGLQILKPIWICSGCINIYARYCLLLHITNLCYHSHCETAVNCFVWISEGLGKYDDPLRYNVVQ